MSKPAMAAGLSAAADEAALVEQARAGDMAALNRLVTGCQDRILNICWRLSGNLDDAHELAQDAFLQATRHIGSFQGKAGFYTWVYRIAVNLSISHRRKMARSPRLSLYTGEGEEIPVAAQDAWPDRRSEDGQDPSERLSSREVQERVLAELGRLDDDHKTVVVLRDIEGFDYQQIAEILEVAVGTVKSRLHRARMELRVRLKGVVTAAD